jgi:hypothetical protein
MDVPFALVINKHLIGPRTSTLIFENVSVTLHSPRNYYNHVDGVPTCTSCPVCRVALDQFPFFFFETRELPCQAAIDQFPFFFLETSTVTWLVCERARAALSIGP